jgi:hypothetical protein
MASGLSLDPNEKPPRRDGLFSLFLVAPAIRALIRARLRPIVRPFGKREFVAPAFVKRSTIDSFWQPSSFSFFRSRQKAFVVIQRRLLRAASGIFCPKCIFLTATIRIVLVPALHRPASIRRFRESRPIASAVSFEIFGSANLPMTYPFIPSNIFTFVSTAMMIPAAGFPTDSSAGFL